MDEQGMIEQFAQVTGDNQQARFFLESSGWVLEDAVNLYFQGGGEQPKQNQPTTPPHQINYVNPNQKPPTPTNDTPPTPTNTPVKQPNKIMGFGDYKVEDNKNKKQQEYYTGGKDSGLAVITPGQEEDIMKKASQSGAKVETHEKKEIPKFSGTGYSLGNSQEVNNNPIPQKDIVRIITIYKNGFTVDDGPLRGLTDPANKEFLSDISNGHVPRELERESKNKGELKVDLVDKRGEEYTPPKKKVESFTGSGQVLGVTTSKVTEIKEVKFHVDENQPFTEIRIRLGNGKTVVGKFNHTHTIGDIKRYVSELTNLPVFQFELMNSFPKEVFNDDKKTVKEAGLIKGNILQKLN